MTLEGVVGLHELAAVFLGGGVAGLLVGLPWGYLAGVNDRRRGEGSGGTEG